MAACASGLDRHPTGAAAGGGDASCPAGAPRSCATLGGPTGAPTVVLLHGWTATADLNWFTCYRPLGRALPGGRHRPPRPRPRHPVSARRSDWRTAPTTPSRSAMCSASTSSSPSATRWAGPIAQLMWQRHRQRVAGLVLCATAAYFSTSREERLGFLGISGLAAVARLTPPQARRWLTEQFYLQRKADQWEPWARRAGGAARLAGGARGGAGDRQLLVARRGSATIDVPTSTLITMRDRVVPVRRQVRLFEAIPDAEAFRVDGDHDAVRRQRQAVRADACLRACRSVVERSR